MRNPSSSVISVAAIKRRRERVFALRGTEAERGREAVDIVRKTLSSFGRMAGKDGESVAAS